MGRGYSVRRVVADDSGLRRIGTVTFGRGQWGRVPWTFHDFIGRLTFLVLFQYHDELCDLNENTDKGQTDALEREQVSDDRHKCGEYHFHIAQSHVHHFHFVVLVTRSLLTSACNINIMVIFEKLIWISKKITFSYVVRYLAIVVYVL